MTVKVIGVMDAIKKRKMCGNCRVTLEYVPHEDVHIEYDEETKKELHRIMCPSCGTKVKVP